MAKLNSVSKKGSRTINMLPVLSNFFEKLMSKQLSSLFESILSKFEFGFTKGYRTQYYLLLIYKKLKLAVHNDEALELF